MLYLTELVYLAAPFAHPGERAFNERLAELVRDYNFPMFMPQEALDRLHGKSIPPAMVSGGSFAFLEKAVNEMAERSPEDLMPEVCMEALNRANLVIAVYYGEDFDPLTAFEVGYATGRRTNVIGLQNELEPALCRAADAVRFPGSQFCTRIVNVPVDHERLTDRLIPILNRFYVPHVPMR